MRQSCQVLALASPACVAASIRARNPSSSYPSLCFGCVLNMAHIRQSRPDGTYKTITAYIRQSNGTYKTVKTSTRVRNPSSRSLSLRFGCVVIFVCVVSLVIDTTLGSSLRASSFHLKSSVNLPLREGGTMPPD